METAYPLQAPSTPIAAHSVAHPVIRVPCRVPDHLYTRHPAQREAALKKTRDRRSRMHKPVISRIPWALLDELEHEKYKLAGEKAVTMLFDHG